jgi:hypothetical protein
MKRIYHPYWLWEDYKNGMYELNLKNENYLIEKAIILLTDFNMFKTTALEVIKKWKVSSKVNLTNPNCNKKAWIGQASCSYKYKVPEYLTRIAWGKLTDEQRIKADNIAIEVIKIFNIENEKQYNQLCLFMEE